MQVFDEDTTPTITAYRHRGCYRFFCLHCRGDHIHVSVGFQSDSGLRRGRPKAVNVEWGSY